MEYSPLYKAAQTWDRLCKFSYCFTYGYKMKLYTINLAFSPSDFPHLAGFQYLRDLALPRYSPAKIVAKILEGIITQEQIEKGTQYEEMVKPRLVALANMEEILNSDFTLYSFMPRFSPFTTLLHADYLISSSIKGDNFVFLIRTDKKEPIRDCLCSSAFVKGNRDFRANQRPYTLMQKTRTELADGSMTILYLRDGFTPLRIDFNQS